jgi:hypothetical protein
MTTWCGYRGAALKRWWPSCGEAPLALPGKGLGVT